MVVGIFAAAGHESLTNDVSPRPVGLYVVVIGAAVAALWLIARAFAPQH
jgi:preprotein translocase subunit Sec61beta